MRHSQAQALMPLVPAQERARSCTTLASTRCPLVAGMGMNTRLASMASKMALPMASSQPGARCASLPATGRPSARLQPPHPDGKRSNRDFSVDGRVLGQHAPKQF